MLKTPYKKIPKKQDFWQLKCTDLYEYKSSLDKNLYKEAVIKHQLPKKIRF